MFTYDLLYNVPEISDNEKNFDNNSQFNRIFINREDFTYLNQTKIENGSERCHA